MAYPIIQLVRNHTVTVAVANWGVAQTHAHNLNDGAAAGGGNGYTPNLVSVTSAYVTIGGENYAISSKTVAITASGATNITFVVGDAAGVLRDALTRAYGVVPTSFTFDVVARFVHSMEMGATATADETIGALAAGAVPVELASMSPGTALETIFVRTAGLDTNNGRTAGTAYLTAQRAWQDVMRASPLYHSVLVDFGPGTFAGNWALDGVELRNGAHLYTVGNVPAGGQATDNTSLSAGAATLTTARDWQGGVLLRWTGDAAWGGAGVPVVGSIGRTVRIDDGAGGHVMWSTVAAVGTGGALATQYVDLLPNPALVGVAPAWLQVAGVVPASVTLQIIDPTVATQVTEISGNVYIGNIKSSGGSAAQPSAETAKQNLLGQLRFTTGTATIEGADRFSYHGTRFENGLATTSCRDCTSNSNAVPQAGVARYWPAAIWTRLGYSHSSSAEAWGGMGFLVNTGNFVIAGSTGTLGGAVIGPVVLSVDEASDIVFASASLVGAATTAISGRARFTYTRSSHTLAETNNGRLEISDWVSFLATAPAADDTVANAPVNSANALIWGNGSGFVSVAVTAAARLEGRNSQGGGAAGGGRVAIRLTGPVTFVSTGGSDANFYGDGGYLLMQDGVKATMTGDRVLPTKVATDATLDVSIYGGCVLRSSGNWTHAVVDTTAARLFRVDTYSTWIHGAPAAAGAGTGIITVGNGAGGGIDCGVADAFLVDNHSHVVVGKARIFNSNAGAGSRAMIISVLSSAQVGSGAGVNDSYLESSSAGSEVDYGIIGAAQPNPLAAAFVSDIAGAGNPEGCTYEIV